MQCAGDQIGRTAAANENFREFILFPPVRSAAAFRGSANEGAASGRFRMFRIVELSSAYVEETAALAKRIAKGPHSPRRQISSWRSRASLAISSLKDGVLACGGSGMTRDETVALFLACEAKRAEQRARALALGSGTMRWVIIIAGGIAVVSMTGSLVRAQSTGASDVAACNTYAAAAIPLEKINSALAVPACERALGEFPTDSHLQFQLGRAYDKGRNIGLAVPLYQKAADQNYAPAQSSLGSLYSNGEGIPQDYAQAVTLFRKSANQGFLGGQYNLGLAYMKGLGVERDYVKAAEWFKKAAEQGLADAQYNLGVFYETGVGVPQNHAQALDWYHKAGALPPKEAQVAIQKLLKMEEERGHNDSTQTDQLAAALKACDDKADQARTVGAPSRPDAFMALNPDHAARAYQDWQVQLRQHIDQVERDRLHCRQQAPQVLAAQQATAQHLKMEEERGYKRTTFDDFKLDGKQLAATQSKIAITGLYLKLGEAEYLFPSVLAVAGMRETLNADVGIGLLTDDAQRNTRKYFLDCQNNPAAAQIGCRINVLGHATMCSRTSLLLGTTELPCLAVEDGW